MKLKGEIQNGPLKGQSVDLDIKQTAGFRAKITDPKNPKVLYVHVPGGAVRHGSIRLYYLRTIPRPLNEKEKDKNQEVILAPVQGEGGSHATCAGQKEADVCDPHQGSEPNGY